MPLKLLLLSNLAATLFLCGLIWFVQIVHYRLFDLVGAQDYRAYATMHARLTTFIVLPPMLLELATSALIARHQPAFSPFVSRGEAWLGVLLVAVIWLSTAFLQVPQHNILGQGFDVAAYRALVLSNWIRVVAWTMRGALVLMWTARLLR